MDNWKAGVSATEKDETSIVDEELLSNGVVTSEESRSAERGVSASKQ